MDNSNKPAYPIDIELPDLPDASYVKQIMEQYAEDLGYGLTKREAFAMAAMQGVLAGTLSRGKWDKKAANAVSKRAIEVADALLKELER